MAVQNPIRVIHLPEWGMLLVHGRFLSSAKGFFPFHGKAQEVRNQAGGEVSRRASDIVKRRGYFCHDNSFEVA